MQDPRIGSVANMSIMENMAFALERGKSRNLFPFATAERKQLFQEKLSLLGMGLENRLNELVANLSGGQRQALSLIMASLADAKILLLDEITAALDPKTATNVMQIANKIVGEEGRTCIMITHNMTQAIEYGDRTLLLANGEFVKEFSSVTKSALTPALLAAEFGEI
jgi:putative ABC transport system ATP-binding protein